jgi:hypothetical protein
VDVFIQTRILNLRREIAAIQRDNKVYKLRRARRGSKVKSEDDMHEERRLRLLAIKEELLTLTLPRKAAA